MYTAVVTPMYTAVFTARMHGGSSRVHGLVHGRVHVYTTLIRATYQGAAHVTQTANYK